VITPKNKIKFPTEMGYVRPLLFGPSYQVVVHSIAEAGFLLVLQQQVGQHLLIFLKGKLERLVEKN
jgi:hypothetical protein